MVIVGNDKRSPFEVMAFPSLFVTLLTVLSCCENTIYAVEGSVKQNVPKYVVEEPARPICDNNSKVSILDELVNPVGRDNLASVAVGVPETNEPLI